MSFKLFQTGSLYVGQVSLKSQIMGCLLMLAFKAWGYLGKKKISNSSIERERREKVRERRGEKREEEERGGKHGRRTERRDGGGREGERESGRS